MILYICILDVLQKVNDLSKAHEHDAGKRARKYGQHTDDKAESSHDDQAAQNSQSDIDNTDCPNKTAYLIIVCGREIACFHRYRRCNTDCRFWFLHD